MEFYSKNGYLSEISKQLLIIHLISFLFAIAYKQYYDIIKHLTDPRLL